MKKICSYCGAKNNQERENCFLCGKDLKENFQTINELGNVVMGNNKSIICSNCGKLNSIEKNFCMLCGKQLKKIEKDVNDEKKDIDINKNIEQKFEENIDSRQSCAFDEKNLVKPDIDSDIKIYTLSKDTEDDDIKIYKKEETLQNDNEVNREEIKEKILEEENFETYKRKRHRLSIITISIILFFVIIASVFTISIFTQVDIETVKDSVVMLEIYDESGEMIATGSGFCAFSQNIIATNFHVIEGAYEIKIITDDNRNYSASKVLIFNADKDLALLEVRTSLTPLKIESNPNIKVGQEVTAIGSPMGELNTVSTGVISNADDDYEIRITAPISGGSSGGVLLNENNKVIGITYAGYDSSYAQNLNFAINSKYLVDLYDSYTSQNYSKISSSNYSSYLGNIDDLADYGFKSNKNYRIDDLAVLYGITNYQKRFEYLLENTSANCYNIYNDLSSEQKEYVIATMQYMDEYDFNYNYSSSDFSNWSQMDFLINIRLLEKYQFAILFAQIIDDSSLSNVVSVTSKMSLDYGLKLIIVQLFNTDMNILRGDIGQEIFNYVNENCSNCRSEILEYLGFTIINNGDGTFYAQWPNI